MNRTRTFWGDFNGPRKRWKIQRDGRGEGALCYPRDVTLHLLAKIRFPIQPSVAVRVIKICTVASVLMVVVCFRSYQLPPALRQ